MISFRYQVEPAGISVKQQPNNQMTELMQYNARPTKQKYYDYVGPVGPAAD